MCMFCAHANERVLVTLLVRVPPATSYACVMHVPACLWFTLLKDAVCRGFGLQIVSLYLFSSFFQMMSMLPGFNGDLLPKGNDQAGQMVMKRFITIIESMSEKVCALCHSCCP